MQTTKGCKSRKTKLHEELADEAELLRCAKEFNMVGDPTRLKICFLLCRHQELSVSEIAEIVGVSVSAVSHTLKKLKEAKLVKSHRTYRHVYYQLKPTPLTRFLKENLRAATRKT